MSGNIFRVHLRPTGGTGADFFPSVEGVSFCLSVCLSIYLSIYLSIRLPLYDEDLAATHLHGRMMTPME